MPQLHNPQLHNPDHNRFVQDYLALMMSKIPTKEPTDEEVAYLTVLEEAIELVQEYYTDNTKPPPSRFTRESTIQALFNQLHWHLSQASISSIAFKVDALHHDFTEDCIALRNQISDLEAPVIHEDLITWIDG